MIRVLLVNEAGLVSDILAKVLNGETDFEMMARASSGDAALRLAGKADVILVGTQLGDEGALELTTRLTSSVVGPKVVVMGLEETEEEIMAFVEAGADGYVLRDDSVDDLLARLRAAHRGEVLVSPGIAAAIMSRLSELAALFSRVDGAGRNVGDLTPREREVLDLVAEGLTNREIAERLVITEGTAKNHVHSILGKLEVTSRHDAAACVAVAR
jgi:DNA-binding NarL/FixJ family response regulator